MKQLIQNYKNGKVELVDVPVPRCGSNNIIVQNMSSLVSIGTERSMVSLGKKSLLGKAKARPDLVKKFIDKAKKEGFLKTFQEALGRLDEPTALGYSSAGVVVEVGSSINLFTPGDRVACIGAGYASHSEYISMPEKLCTKLPDNVTYNEASYGMLGIIALHGIRSAKLTLGSTVSVIGLGLLGLISVQILKAYGCRVIGFDIDKSKVDLAKELGADLSLSNESEFIEICEKFTAGNGVDASIITAATNSDKPVNTAVEISKYGGKIVIVGVADIHPSRNEMWHKEVEIIVSRAGGAGSFDPFYENKGIDYPFGYVRWTQNRNLEEFLRLISIGSINLETLKTHSFQISEMDIKYLEVIENKNGPYIGVLINYPEKRDIKRSIINPFVNTLPIKNDQINLGVIGAGLFGKALLIPALSKIKSTNFHTLATSSGTSSFYTGRKYKFQNFTTDHKEILKKKEIDAVIVTTPHSTHANMVIYCIKNEKHVFVEKPLCISEDELNNIIEAYNSKNPLPRRGAPKERGGSPITSHSSPVLMVGYNRRFSPHTQFAMDQLSNRQSPLVINYRINTGFVPSDHWVHSEEEGGSRILGEVVHFIDLIQTLTKSTIVSVYADRVSGNNSTILNSDNSIITLKLADGSIGNIVYTASGDKAYSREFVEIFSDGKTLTIEDFRKSKLYSPKGNKVYKTKNQEMGYTEELNYFINRIKGKSEERLSFNEIINSTLTAIKITESMDTAKRIAF